MTRFTLKQKTFPIHGHDREGNAVQINTFNHVHLLDSYSSEPGTIVATFMDNQVAHLACDLLNANQDGKIKI